MSRSEQKLLCPGCKLMRPRRLFLVGAGQGQKTTCFDCRWPKIDGRAQGVFKWPLSNRRS